MLTKYKTDRYRTDIEAVNVLRETEQCVFLPTKRRGQLEQREAKVSDWHRYHDSWEAAHAYLMERAAIKLGGARRDLQLAQSEYGNVKGMKPPALSTQEQPSAAS